MQNEKALARIEKSLDRFRVVLAAILVLSAVGALGGLVLLAGLAF